MELENKVAIVTGAASGIGRAIAIRMAKAGATVAALDRNADGLANTVAAIGDNARAYEVDLSDASAITAARDAVLSTHGLPHVLINAAGFDRVEPFMSNDDELWQALVAVNFLGPVRLTRAVLDSVLAEGSPLKIVNIASDAGRVGSLGETVYAVLKGGVIAFTKSLAREMARLSGSTSTACAPVLPTPRCSPTLPDKVKDSLVRAIPFRRLGTPEEVANSVLFFASDYANFVTGK